ncbi:site-specific DNA-methyltransferase [Candidatus Falkowbacteria bacterium CG10_big_fil_rev_8_21_14_0_10_44_15]|uniref:Methyltransferase n=1 Tax=Candidatus Falkowbacteria bacterium CG10_big_fil_rev_8_21_14_0_10_44_15 TaxID=1974569 RepID=A0A2H0V006_9BACT|nr:MAG: site-specific DNA-methyltransferase [Candidatus Falkowbacteria bacterium CG10_big_fil_rev_8_21_14_0_10_44_15]
MDNRTLYFGDNLEILRKKVPDESFDLIYLDPPFNSNRNYNVLFKEGLVDSEAQIQAFEDSWQWTQETKQTFDYLVSKTNDGVSNLMLAFEKMIGNNDMLAYLTMMTVRLIELHRVLKKTGSLYLHCDPTASHYLKLVLDVIFGKNNFVNEIIWYYPNKIPDKRKKLFTQSSDRLLFYAKNRGEHIFNLQEEKRENPITVTKMKKVDGKKIYVRGEDGKVILITRDVRIVDDIWRIPMLMGQSERLGYPTQKPEALLERIIKASSSEGDWILDPFCGCGTTVSVAERLNREWVGIDITMLAINLIKKRLKEQFEDKNIKINIDGLPKDLTGAAALAKRDRFEFEYWALSLIDAMPAKSKSEENMRGADKGIDGTLAPIIGFENGREQYGRILVQVKSGGVKRNDIATLKGDIEREKAIGGVFITLEKPTKPMLEEAVLAGDYSVKFFKGEFPKIQILTIEELLHGRKLNIPLWSKPYHKKAKKVEIEENKFQRGLGV